MLLLAFFVTLASAVSIASEANCNRISRYINSPGVQVTAVHYLPAGSLINLRGEAHNIACLSEVPPSPIPFETCRAVLEIATSSSSSVVAVVWLPDEWKGRLLSVGKKNFDGCADYPQMAYGTSLGFATVGSNGGYDGISAGDFLNQTEVLVEDFYSSLDFKSYHIGCCTGGRQALRAAQVDPSLFDGLVAGAPAVNLGNTIMWYGSLLLGLFSGDTSNTLLTEGNWDVVHQEALRKCGALDNAKDGIIKDPRRCNLQTLALNCWVINRKDCLSTQKVLTVDNIFSKHEFGINYSYPGAVYGSEVAFADALLRHNETLVTLIKDWYHYISPGNTSWETTELDFNKAWRALKDAPPELQPLSADLTAFRDRGGKIFAWHGAADPLISVANSDRCFDNVLNVTADGNRNAVDEFYHYFRLSGAGHCGEGVAGAYYVGQDGRGTPIKNETWSDGNVLFALAEWVEKGEAPETLRGVKWVDDDEGKGVEFARKHCRYPLANWYEKGGGGKDEEG